MARGVESNETHNLIASDKVEGTSVYNRKGEHLGTVKNFMVDKVSGKVEYAVLEFGGFLGMGQNRYPLPWGALDYDTEKNGYVVDIDKETLEDAPYFVTGQEPSFSQDYGRSVNQHYGIPYGM